jgi:hypothetical protein
MFIELHDRPLFGAPAERNVPVVKYVETISLLWGEEPYRARSSMNVRSPGTQRLVSAGIDAV